MGTAKAEMVSPLERRAAAAHRARKALLPWVFNGVMIAVCILVLIPVLLTIATSLKQQTDVQRNPPVLFPCDTPEQGFDPAACRWSTEGYQRIMEPRPNSGLLGVEFAGRMLTTYLPNTILYALFGSFLVTVLAGMSGYAFSRYRFRGRQALMIAILAITGIPLLTNLIALYQMGVVLRRALPGYEERLFVTIVYVGFYLPFSIWIVKSFFDTIPRELEEASFIDGCSPVGALWRIVAPLAAPGLTAAFLMTFVGIWNEFIAGYLLVGKPALRTAMFGLYDFIGQFVIGYQILAAGCIVVALPVVIMFLFFRKTFFNAMVEGALKG